MGLGAGGIGEKDWERETVTGEMTSNQSAE
jgi:hypothetical protein